jgi:crotonobetaine/carnitine-CoA ligase
MKMKEYEYSQQALGSIIKDKAEQNKDKPYLQFEEEKPLSYLEVDEITNRLANGLISLGVGKGDKVSLFLPNSLEMVYSWFAFSKLGTIDVPINLANKGFFLSHVINNSESKLIIIDRQLLDRLKLIEDDLPKLQTVVIRSKPGSTEEIPKLKFDIRYYEELLSASAERPEADVKPSDTQSILYTSGTTGPSKGVMMSHEQIYVEASECVELEEATSEDVYFTSLPVFHANARYLSILPAMLADAKVVIYERFSASRFWDQIRKANATIFNTLGAVAMFLYNQPRKPNDGDNPARICFAAPIPAEIIEDFEDRFKLKCMELYGLTETGAIVYNTSSRAKPGSCGKATKSFEVAIVDEEDRPVPPEVVGEIVCRGRYPWAMSIGYYSMPDKTAEAYRNFWFHTGDAGFLDEESYLYFRDRMKDYIRRRGENISSYEVEAVVNAHPQVLESAAVAVKSEVGEDEVKVVVVPKPSEEINPVELLDFCQDRMPHFAVPRYVEFVDELPKTPNEKVQKAKLREAGITENTWDRESIGYKVKR